MKKQIIILFGLIILLAIVYLLGTIKSTQTPVSTITPNQNENYCNYVLGKPVKDFEGRVKLPLTCDDEVIKDGKKIQFTFNRDGSFEAKADNSSVLKLPSFEDENPLDSDKSHYADILRWEEEGGLADNVFAFNDINFDGYKDITIRSNSGAYNFTFDYYVYNQSTGFFDKDPIVSAVNPVFDLNAKTITSHSLGRGVGDIYFDEVYHFEDGKYVLIKTENQNELDENINQEDVDNYKYRHVIRELKSGVWATTTDKILTGNIINI
jgi:hypothetical protein